MPSEMPSFPFRSQCTDHHNKTNKTSHTSTIVHLFYHTMLSPVVQFAIQQKKIVTLCFCAFQATCTNRTATPLSAYVRGWLGLLALLTLPIEDREPQALKSNRPEE